MKKRRAGFIDITGKCFGHLLVLRDSGHSDCGGGVEWLCRCKCGKIRKVRSTSLRFGITRSCGSCAKITHGKSRTLEYFIWQGIKDRCLNPRSVHWADYGGRGIKVAEYFQGPRGFVNFIWSIGPRPSLRHTVDRIKNNKGYVPGNVRWATPITQSNNRRWPRSRTATPLGSIESEIGIA
jgi:hypothetical protein